jgi:hypothetical protein
MIPRQIVTLLILLGVFVFALISFSSQNYALLILGILTPPVLILASRLKNIGMAVIALYYSTWTLPGLPMDLQLYQVMILFFILVAIAQRIVVKQESPRPPGIRWAQLFVILLLVVLYVRGIGFRMLGDDKVGGAAYVHIFIALLFYFLSGVLVLSPQQWRRAIITMVAFIFISFLLHLSVILSGGSFWYPLLFMKVTFALRETFSALQQDASTTRWSIIQPFVIVYMVPVLFFAFNKRNAKYYILFFLVSIVCALLSGLRSLLLQTLIFMALYIIFSSRRRMLAAMGILCAGLLGLGLLISFSEHLPFGVQRVLTMVPGVQVSSAAEIDARQTIEWRLSLWRVALADIHNYFWIGRGFAYDYGAFLSSIQHQFSKWDYVRSAVIAGDFHLGPLDIVYMLGIPIFLAIVGWVATDLIWHLRRQKTSWRSLTLRRYHFAFLVQFSSYLLLYCFSGSARYMLPTIFFYLAVLHGLAISDGHAEDDTSPSSNSDVRPTQHILTGSVSSAAIGRQAP